MWQFFWAEEFDLIFLNSIAHFFLIFSLAQYSIRHFSCVALSFPWIRYQFHRYDLHTPPFSSEIQIPHIFIIFIVIKISFCRCDCVGILKERNVDVEHRFPDQTGTRNKKKSTRCRMVFRTTITNLDGTTEVLQVCSQQIVCSKYQANILHYCVHARHYSTTLKR